MYSTLFLVGLAVTLSGQYYASGYPSNFTFPVEVDVSGEMKKFKEEMLAVLTAVKHNTEEITRNKKTEQNLLAAIRQNTEDIAIKEQSLLAVVRQNAEDISVKQKSLLAAIKQNTEDIAGKEKNF